MSNIPQKRIDELLSMKELLEDTIEYYCDEHLVSGECAWIMVKSLAEAKLKVEFPDER